MSTSVYVSCSRSGEIVVLRLHEGRLAFVERVACDGSVMPLATPSEGRFLYAARRADPYAVLSFVIDPAGGGLRLLGAAPLPESMAYLAADRDGRWLFSASYGGSLVAVSAVSESGIAEAAHQVLATPPKAHAIRVDRGNRFVYATSLGADQLLRWPFDAASGQLDEAGLVSTPVGAGSGPRHFVWNASGERLYLLGELDASISVYDCSEAGLALRQVISALPPGFEGEPWAADIHLTPDGSLLVASERRSSTLALFAVDATSGELTPRGSFPTEANPRGFAIDPSGRWLIAAGQDSGAVQLYAIDAAGLTPLQSLAVGDGPNWVQIVVQP